MKVVIIVIEVLLLVGLSAICSGLNVAIMSLDLPVLKRRAKLGNKKAKRVLGLRKNIHLTLASILLANVAVISASSLVLDSWLNGLLAGVISTLLIVIFGEVVPQALFSRHALHFTARFTPFLWLLIIISYPISKPLQLLLDKLIGHTPPRLQSRRELGLLIAEHSTASETELDEGEIGIMQGALSLSEKRVRDIMTPIRKVYWLNASDIIDGTRIDDLKKMAHSRIPVFNKSLSRCYGLLLLKDLVDMDFDEKPQPVEDLDLRPTSIVGNMTALDTLLRKFVNSHTHLLPVEKDDRIVGIVTIEDLLEEVIGQEIRDEKDFLRNI